jgi:hypothetical protein
MGRVKPMKPNGNACNVFQGHRPKVVVGSMQGGAQEREASKTSLTET